MFTLVTIFHMVPIVHRLFLAVRKKQILHVQLPTRETFCSLGMSFHIQAIALVFSFPQIVI
jgi:hypothetical protein